MARPTKKEEVESKNKRVVVEVKTLEKPSPKPSLTSKKPISSAPLANPFDLLDEDSSDLISIVDAKEDDAFVASERKRIEEEKKAEREAKIKVKEEEKKAAREAKKRAIQEKKARDVSILGFHSARPNPNPSDSRGPKSASTTDDVQSQLAKNPSGVDLQVKEIQGGVVEDGAASVDGSSSISSDGRRRANVNGSLRRKQKKKKAEGEGDNQPEKQSYNAAAAPVVNNNYPRSYTLKEYEERKKREEVEKNKKADVIDSGMDHKQKRYDNGGQRRFANGGPRRVVNDKQQAPVEKTVAEKVEASFSLEDSDFPVLGARKVAGEKVPTRKMVAGKAVGQVVAKKSGAKKT